MKGLIFSIAVLLSASVVFGEDLKKGTTVQSEVKASTEPAKVESPQRPGVNIFSGTKWVGVIYLDDMTFMGDPNASVIELYKQIAKRDEKSVTVLNTLQQLYTFIQQPIVTEEPKVEKKKSKK